MKINKDTFLKAHNFAWDILDYSNSGQKLLIGNKISDLDTVLFKCDTYPFKLSFDDLVYKIDTIAEDGVDNLNEDDFNLISQYIKYINTTLADLFNLCKDNELQEVYLAKLSIFDRIENSGTISKYAVAKETQKRVHYYSILDEDVCDEDILSVSKSSFETSIITLGTVCTASIWCYEKDKEHIFKRLEEDIKNALIEKLNKVENYKIKEKSYIKL